ncbi:MAG: hypothetical protein JOZ32_04010 [Bryobacterales bacterium]|nr:hypothetical protein [Bryobacterales bacterium]
MRAIRRQVEKDNVVGLIVAHTPDFEFANFSVKELAEIAARVDAVHGFSGAKLRGHDWTGISNGKAFESKYRSVSQRKRGTLKGEAWGRALAAHAIEHPRKDDGTERPIWNQVHGAWYGWMANYDSHRESFRFDPATFELIQR